MKVSIVITVFNEEKTISKLLDSLQEQTKKPSEIIIIDAKSTDRTVEIIRHYQKKNRRIKLLIEKCSRSRGRNIGVELASNDIIAITDAGCVVNKYWLERITKPFENKEVDLVAGFYKMMAENKLQKAMSYFLGVLPSQFDVNFLPSTRSVALKKDIWLRVGGFPEKLSGTAEDTVFGYKCVKSEARIARVKNARVEWGMPREQKPKLDILIDKLGLY